ncbi:MAG: hypothetical protein M1830_002682 [Pleopsidium flavum]|nr:MAG: hypothetical protein M1830_002682 [Pleopsidium flavum]
MDPFSAEGELLNMHNAFYSGQYQPVVDFDTSSLSAENALPARVLQLRAQIANGQAERVIAQINGADQVPDLACVEALAQHASGDTHGALEAVEHLVSTSSENETVQLLGGTVLQAEGKSEEALTLLAKHQGNLEAVALIVQIHLQQNRTDLALKEVQAARRWAQDSLLVNIAESWVGLRVGGEKYQQAFYVFEEMAQGPSTSATRSLIGQAVAELHLGRLPEAEAALQQTMQNDSRDAEAIANTIVLSVLSGKDITDLVSYVSSLLYLSGRPALLMSFAPDSLLQSTAPQHAFLSDLQEKSALFDQAATKYSAKLVS